MKCLNESEILLLRIVQVRSRRRPPSACRFLFYGTCRASGLYIRHIPHPEPTLARRTSGRRLSLISTTPALSSLLQPLQTPPLINIPSLTGFHLDLNCPQSLANTNPLNGPGADDIADDDSNYYLDPLYGASLLRQPKSTALELDAGRDKPLSGTSG